MDNLNRKIFSKYHSGKNLTHDANNLYDKSYINIKSSLLKKYTYSNNLNIIDLCCGSGEFSKYLDTKKNSYFGIDFTYGMLNEFKYSNLFNKSMSLTNADANNIPIDSEKIDCCFCFSSLYYFENISTVLSEINRVLKYDGVAILEFATKDNINAFVSNYRALHNNWGSPYFISYKELINSIKHQDFEILEERNFQFFPVLRGPWWSIFFANSFLKPILQIKINNKILDEHISSINFMKKYAFKHLIVLRKRAC